MTISNSVREAIPGLTHAPSIPNCLWSWDCPQIELHTLNWIKLELESSSTMDDDDGMPLEESSGYSLFLAFNSDSILEIQTSSTQYNL